ncbi:MAG: nth [Bacillales bacterium]|jgi:endonuclease-3|nr:nth [Bacillales bacterium]
MKSKKKVLEILDKMEDMFPNAECELYHRNEFDLLIAVLLSAQCTDKLVNKVTAELFQKYSTPSDYLKVPLSELERDIKSIGLYRNKAKNIQSLCEMLINSYNNSVPESREELIKLPGVGRKTANVVMSVAFNTPAIAVDTHVERVSKRLGITKEQDSVLQVEEQLMKQIPVEKWNLSHHLFIFFGRYHCKAKNPQCNDCNLSLDCKFIKKKK